MAINMGKYSFEGPYPSADNLKSQSGVYAILGRNTEQDQWKVVDIGESESMRDRTANHDRSDCWKRRGHRILNVAALYCDARTRMVIEKELRTQFNPPCGDR
jgi:hypothetical protein